MRPISQMSDEIAAGITGQMNVEIDKSGYHGLVGKVYDAIGLERVGRAFCDVLDPAVFDQDDGWTGWATRRVRNKIADQNGLRAGQGRRCGGQADAGKQDIAEHVSLPDLCLGAWSA